MEKRILYPILAIALMALLVTPLAACGGDFEVTPEIRAEINKATAKMVGPAGPQGPAGADGTDGVDGATGPAGDIGPTGKGTQGDVGAQGEPGPQGPSGDDGAAGSIGATGATGATGHVGLAGPQGLQGPAGSDAACCAAPVIDGVISPCEWPCALWFDEMLDNTFTAPTVMSVQIYVMNDTENLYIALVAPDIYDMRANPEVAEGGSDTFGLNIGVVGEERSYSRILQFNTTDRTVDPNWFVLDGYFAQWAVATTEANTSLWGPDVEFGPIPEGVQSMTTFNGCRVQEIAIPLSDLGVASGALLRIGGCMRAAEFEGYNFHTKYPVGLDWGVGATYKGFLVR